MKRAILGLMLLSAVSHARDLTFQWTPGSEVTGVVYELRTSYNSASWITTTTPGLTATRSYPLVPGDKLKAEVRALPADATVTCGTPPGACEPSQWVTFDGVPYGNDIVYPNKPNTTVQFVSPGVSRTGAFATKADIGTISPAGSLTESGNVFSIRAGKGEVGTTADSVFYASKTIDPVLYSNRTISAFVNSVKSSEVATRASVGLDFRQNRTPGSAHYSLTVSKYGTITQHYRTTQDAPAVLSKPYVTNGIPLWIKINKVGKTFQGQFSYDGANWVNVDQQVAVDIDSSGLFFMGMMAYGSSALETGTYADFSLSRVTGFW